MPRPLVLVAALLICPAFATADDAVDVRAAAKRFYESITQPDVGQCLAASDGFAGEKPMILAWHAAYQAEQRLTKALDARFPADGPHQDPMSVMKPEYIPALPLARIAVKGDNASMYAPGESPTTGIRFKRVSGVWKFHSMAHPFTEAEKVDVIRRYAKSTADTAEALKQGRFASAQEAYVERLDKLAQLSPDDDAPAKPKPPSDKGK